MAKIKVKCEVCGKELERLESQLKKHIFCSKECSNSPEGRKIYQGGKNHPRYNSEVVKCHCCGKEFKINKYIFEHNKYYYCSRDCYKKDVTNIKLKGKDSPFYNRVKCNCDYCGKEIEITPCKMKDREKHFCNKECQTAWQKENWVGENSPNWKHDKTDEDRIIERQYTEYTDMVQEALKLANYTCVISGQVGGSLRVHHLNGYNWDIEHRLDLNNVVVITEELHNEFHKIYGKGKNTLEQFKEFYKDKTGKDFKIN